MQLDNKESFIYLCKTNKSFHWVIMHVGFLNITDNVECMSSGTYTEPLNYATNFNVPLLHTHCCKQYGLIAKNFNI